MDKPNLFVITSGVIAILLILLILNFFFDIIPIQRAKTQGLAVFLPIFISPIGALLAGITLKTAYKPALWVLVAHIILFAFPFAYFLFGTIFSGP